MLSGLNSFKSILLFLNIVLVQKIKLSMFFTMVLYSISNKVVSFEGLKDDYSSCPNFGIIFTDISVGQGKEHIDFLLCDGYLYKSVKLCIPHTSLLDILIWELHAGGLAGYFGRDKAIALVEDRFY